MGARQPLRDVSRARGIAVIDDNDELRTALAEMLDHEGWHVETYPSGAEAWRRFAEHAPDAVLTDINAGRFTGPMLAVALRQDPRFDDVPVIAMSGCVTPSTEVAALFDGFLAKPVDFGTLDTRLRTAIAARRRRRARAR